MKRVPLSLTKDCRITFIGNLRFDSETIEKEQIFLVYLKKVSIGKHSAFIFLLQT